MRKPCEKVLKLEERVEGQLQRAKERGLKMEEEKEKAICLNRKLKVPPSLSDWPYLYLDEVKFSFYTL